MDGSMERGSRNPHKAAALAYGGLGVLVILITFAADLVPPSRANALGQLGIGGIFVLGFAVLLYWRGWWVLSAFLSVTNAWRATHYFNAGIGLHLNLRDFSITPIESKPVAFVNAALMVVIVFMLVRSSWIGFADWRKRRLVGREA